MGEQKITKHAQHGFIVHLNIINVYLKHKIIYIFLILYVCFIVHIRSL